MKKIKNTFKVAFIFLLIAACTDNIRDLGFAENIPAPTNVSALYAITQDNTGLVTILPNAVGANNFDILFGDATTTPTNVIQGQSIDHTYPEGNFNITIIAYNINGDATQVTQPLVVSFKAPENLEVAIENDIAISKQIVITASADFATMYEFYSGELDVTQPVVSGNIGETITYTYAAAGTYTVKVVAKGGAIATTEITQEFTVTEILAPLNAAPKPPNRDEVDVISIFSDAYTNIADTNLNPNWGQQTVYSAFDIDGDAIIQYSNLNYQGIDIGSEIDASAMETLHIDIWTTDATSINIYPLPNGVQPADERFVTKELVANQWNSFEIPMTEFTSQGLPVDKLKQFKFTGAGTVFIDNIYFYRASTNVDPFDGGLLTNGDFENGSESWLIGVDDSSSAPVVTVDGNTYYSVNVTGANASQPFLVNTSQKLEIIQGNTYTLTFDAWSDVNRSIIGGIGLSGGDFSNDSKPVDITTTKSTYTLSLSSANFGTSDSRVLFDLNGENGLVNIDNVSLTLDVDNLLKNGDFENGSEFWLVGVVDSTSTAVVTVDNNTYYSVNVTNADSSQPFLVNTSQKLEIIQGNTYTLTFDAWSDVNRAIIGGIGLSGGDFSNDSKPVDITTTRTTYTLSLSSANFGTLDSRVLFDLNGENGLVNIDNVLLTLD